MALPGKWQLSGGALLATALCTASQTILAQTALPPISVTTTERPAPPKRARPVPRRAQPAPAPVQQPAASSAQSVPTQAEPAQSEPVPEAPAVAAAPTGEEGPGRADAAVTVRNADELEKAGVKQVQDLEKVFPGLEIRSRGSRAYANVSVRGMSSPDFYNPSVQVLVDGVPQDSTYFTQELLNVERVELLRGPQGTLFGPNTYAGVINIITRKPDDVTRTSVATTISTKDQNVQVAVSGALVPGVLFGELAVGFGRELGTVDDLRTGEEDIDDSSDRNFRVKLRYAPIGSPWDVTFSVQHEDLHSNEEVALASIHDKRFDSALFGHPFYDREVTSVALNASYDFGGSKLTSITAFQDRTLDRLAYQLYQPEEQQTPSQEFRYTFGDPGHTPWSGVVGAFFENTDFTRETGQFDTVLGPTIGPSENDIVSTSYAAFGEVTYKLTESVDITGGARVSYDKSEIDYERAALLLPELMFREEADFTNVSPKAAIGWQVDAYNRLYALVSRGYKPGGFNHAVSSPDDAVAYKEETSTNFEIGWKASLLDDRLQLRTTAYAISAEDKQIYVAAEDPTSQALGLLVLRNLGDSRSIGVETELVARPVESVRTTLGVNYGRSVFVDSFDTVAQADYSGNRLPYAPDFTAKATFEYFLPKMGLPGNISLRGAARYNSESFFDPANTLKQGGFAIFDAAIDWKLENGLDVSFFVDNIADKEYRTYSFESGGTAYSTLGDGRVVGMRAKMSW